MSNGTVDSLCAVRFGIKRCDLLPEPLSSEIRDISPTKNVPFRTFWKKIGSIILSLREVGG